MNRRKLDQTDIKLLNQEEFEIFIELEKTLKPYLKTLLFLFKSRNIPFTLMILKTNSTCINEIKNNIRNSDLVFSLPGFENYYLIVLQNTNIKTAIKIGSRLSSLITREFLIKKEIFYHQIALISIETKAVKTKEIIYQIISSMDNQKLDKNEKELWKKILKI